LADALGHVKCAEVIGVRQEDDEFFAAESRQHVGLAQRFVHGFRDAAQQFVAAEMTMGVVDALEVIGVDEKQGGLRAVAAGAIHSRWTTVMK